MPQERRTVYDGMREVARLVNPVILGVLEPLKHEQPGLYDIVAHLPRIKVGENLRASMLRPTLVVLGWRAVSDGDWQRAIPLAAAVELLNISTYVIDDIFDHCDVRHSEPTVHVRYGAPNAIIAGFILRELAAKTLAVSDFDVATRSRLQDLLVETHYTIYLGQHHDLTLNDDREVSVEEYLRRTRKITAAFIQNCILCGAIAAVGEEPLEALRRFGDHYGLAVQLRNDLMDFVVPDQRITHSMGFKGLTHADFKEGKRTLPVIHALAEGTPAQRDRVRALLGRKDLAEAELGEANAILAETGSFRHCCRLVLEHREQALAALDSLGSNAGVAGLRQLAEILDNVEHWRFTA